MAEHRHRLALLVHHTDARREWAYDRQSPIGRLHLALDQARRVIHPPPAAAPDAPSPDAPR